MAESLVALAAALRSGALPLEEYLAQLKAHFTAREPDVLAFMPEEGRFERLRREAAALVQRFPTAEGRPPLFGVPVGVKDVFHVEGFVTRAGSRLPPEVLRGPQAESVTRLKDAGTLILGKTVTTEFAYFAPGPTRNPRNPAHTPGGSSSGSAAAVAAGLCPLALGTQTIGSIIRPAAFCGVVGFKPTYERVSRAGVIPLSISVDHVGPFANDVAGVALAASVLCADWHSQITERRPVLGIPTGPYLDCATPEGLAHFDVTCEWLRAAGYEVRAVAAMPDFAHIRQHHEVIVAADAAATHAEWFARYSDQYHPRTAALITQGQAVETGALDEARVGRGKLRAELAQLMEANGIDTWVAPSAPGPAPKGLDSTGDPVMDLPWTHAGLPAVNLPFGLSAEGLPFGLQLVAGWNEDERLLAWAEGIEAAFGGEAQSAERET